MSLRRAGVLAVSGVLVAAGAALSSTPATAQPAAPVLPSVQTLAVNAAADLVAARPALLHASAADTFVRQNVLSSNGLQYVPYQRTYRGLPVVGGDFVVVTDSAGRVLNTSVAQERTIDLPGTTPKLTAAQAQRTAATRLAKVSHVAPATLVTYALGTPRLAWQTTVSGTGKHGPSKLLTDVDALTGKVLRTRELVLHGTGNTAWNANPVSLDTTKSGSTYSMKDPKIRNLSCQNAANNQTFTGPDDSWGNGDATNRETGCADALFAAQTESRMLAAWLGRNGPDGNGGAWPIRIGLDDQNAYYDGSQIQIGHNTKGGWVGAIDVLAHEQGHGIDDHTPGGISGGNTQEFIADAFGAATEWYANEATGDTPDYTVGEQVNLVGKGPIRDMSDPSKVGHPNCYSLTIPLAEVHAAAGPGNHWFYLLAEGSNPTNGQPKSPTCNNSTLQGVGIRNAITVLYNAMLMKNITSSYTSYRVWTLTSAKNLDASCALYTKVKAAWNAVSVPAQLGEPSCTPR